MLLSPVRAESPLRHQSPGNKRNEKMRQECIAERSVDGQSKSYFYHFHFHFDVAIRIEEENIKKLIFLGWNEQQSRNDYEDPLREKYTITTDNCLEMLGITSEP